MMRVDERGLELDDLRVGYGKKPLLSGIRLSVDPGMVLTLIGPNGSGKSTILKTITRQLKSMGGKVILLGGDMAEMNGNEIAKTLSMVMTERTTPELMSCREVVGTGRYPYVGYMGILRKEDWDVVDQSMRIVHADDVAEQGFQEISDGQRQRVMLARALCQEPKVLVLDEPTSYLDVHFKLDILEQIRKLSKERGIAVIMSLHELDLAMKVSDLVALVDGRGISKIGKPEEVFVGDCIHNLYQIEKESFNPLTGALYLVSEKKPPRVFVISGGGSGIPLFYKLQREGIPFAAGILWENDCEMDAARACASQVIGVKAFMPAGKAETDEAKKAIDACESVIIAVESFGVFNECNRELMEYARQKGKLNMACYPGK